MKKLNSRILSALMALLLVFSLLPGITFTADAATVNYLYADTDKYSDVIVNWGIREEPATFLSPNAKEFYKDTSYDELIVLDAGPLYTALYKLMSDNHTTLTKYDNTRDAYRLTDCQNNGAQSKMISGFYSGEAIISQWDGGLTWNREHTWPQSKTTKGNEVDDIMSIRPELGTVNSSRGDKAYGESAGFYNPNKNDVYDVRGDAARVILYTYVRWGGESAMSATIQSKLFGSNGVIESEAVLLKWIREDPVDTWEMARNDSVESITGTRNVFVDYPELAFALFDEAIPDMDTPSGEADRFAYTIKATSNNTSYGTVEVNHNHVTAVPKAGYRVSGYQITSGSAQVEQNADVFTLTTKSNCTIRIDFEKTPTYTAKFLQDGKQLSSQKAEEGNCVILPSFTGDLPEGYTFRGWVDTIVYNTKVVPAQIYAAGSEYILQSDVTFYALLSWQNMNDTSAGEVTYKLVTKASQLAAGKTVVLVAADYNRALSTTQNSNNRGAVDVIKNDNTLVFDENGSVQILTLANGTVGGTYGFKTGSSYLYAASSSSNWLRTKSSLDANGSFKITVNTNGTCTVVSQGNYSRNMLLYNSQSNIFSCYAGTSTQAKTITLYVGEKGGTTYYTMAWTYVPETTCPHSSTTTVTVPASCTQSGSVSVTCTACGEVLSSKILPAQHQYRYEEIAPTLSTGGGTREYCSLCGDETIEDPTDPLTHIESWSLTLGDDVSVNFKIDVDSSIRSTAKIHISVAGDKRTHNVIGLTENSDGYYYLTVKVSAAQMTDEIAVQITNGTDASEKKVYTVRDYALAILSGNYSQATKNLVKQMLHYGAAAQTYFAYKEDTLANANVEAASHAAPETTNVFKATGELEGIEFYGATLVFRDRIALRYYFTVTDDISDYTFTANGKTLTPVQKGAHYYVEVAEINPQDLDDMISVTVNGSLRVDYSPMNYIVNMRQKGTRELQALVQALYDYHLAAKVYAAD